MTMDGIPAVMSVTPSDSGGSNRNNGNGWGGDWGAWIILFLIFGIFGGWGGFGGFGGGFGGGAGGGIEPVLQRSLDTQTIIGKLDGITNGLCDGFYAQAGAVNNLGTTVMQGFNAANVAMLQGQNALQSQLSSCCCNIERAIDGVNYNNATNACAIQTSIANSARDIVDNSNSNTRAILDYLCQDKISTLQQENQSLRLAASQSAQNTALMAAMEANTAEILRRTGNTCPQPAYIVQPPQPVSFQTNCAGQATFNGFSNGGCCGSC